MKWQDIFLALVRCEFKAGYSCFDGWQLSAKSALPVVGDRVGRIMERIGVGPEVERQGGTVAWLFSSPSRDERRVVGWEVECRR